MHHIRKVPNFHILINLILSDVPCLTPSDSITVQLVSCLQCKYPYLSLKKVNASHTRSLPSVGPGADPGVQAVSQQVTISHPPGGRLPLLSARPAVTFPAAQHHRPLAGTNLYCLVTEAHSVNNLSKVVTQLCPE